MATFYQDTKRWLEVHCGPSNMKSTKPLDLEALKAHMMEPRVILYLSLGLVLIITAIVRLTSRKATASSRPRSPDPEKPLSRKPTEPARPFGTWTPVDFKRPTPPAYPNWSVTGTKPLPYRPFRYGPKYNITMGLRSMNMDEWIELDNHWSRYHADKVERINSRGSKCSYTEMSDPRVVDGAVELLEELCDYLPQRYPSLFVKTEFGMKNVVDDETFDIRRDVLTCNGVREDPMQLAGRMTQDDLAIMFEKEDGQYYLLAGSILLAGFWRLEDKLGMPLSEIHTSGDVPGYKEKLEKGMMNFFRRIKPDAPVLRNNYFIQLDDNLPWSTTIGPEDGDETRTWDSAEDRIAVEHHYFRSERQSLRRLPRSGGVVFTIRTYFHLITDICQDPYVPGRLASAVRSWGEDVDRYKGGAKYRPVLLEYLDKMHAEQVANGLDLSKEDDVRQYPL